MVEEIAIHVTALSFSPRHDSMIVTTPGGEERQMVGDTTVEVDIRGVIIGDGSKITNFNLFSGEHELVLRPRQPKRPDGLLAYKPAPPVVQDKPLTEGGNW